MTDPATGRHEADPLYEVAPASATEPKVYAATGGATAGVITTNFVLYLLSGWFYDGADVPMVVALFVGLLITSGFTFAGGYVARHVNRPQPSPSLAAFVPHEAP